MTQTIEPTLFHKREALRKFYSQGIKPIDSRQPIPEELAQEIVKQLLKLGVPKDALIGVIDTFLTLTLTLKEHGYNNITLLENKHSNLTEHQERYYNNIRGICDKIEVKYYVPPMNNWSRCNMKFDVIIGNPPYQNGKHKSTTNSLWKEFLENSFRMSKQCYLVLPDIALAPPTFSKYKNNIVRVNTDIKRHFPGVGSGFCTIFLDKNPKDTLTITTKDNEYVIPIASLDFIPNNFNQSILDDIKKYLTGTRKWDLTYEYESRKNIFCDDGKYEVLHTPSNGIRRTNQYHPNNDLIRVSVDVSGHPKFHLIQNMGLTQSHYWTIFDNVKDAKDYVEWGNSDEVQSFLRKLKWGGMNSALVIKNLK